LCLPLPCARGNPDWIFELFINPVKTLFSWSGDIALTRFSKENALTFPETLASPDSLVWPKTSFNTYFSFTEFSEVIPICEVEEEFSDTVEEFPDTKFSFSKDNFSFSTS
jgi:hypothetical protein